MKIIWYESHKRLREGAANFTRHGIIEYEVK